MGLTDASMVTTEGQKNWADACERETTARYNWNGKWGWIPELYLEPVEKLKALKQKQIARIQKEEEAFKDIISKDPRPLPNSVNHEYGWLAYKQDYQLERFGPFPLTMKVRLEPTLKEIEDEIAKQDLYRPKKTQEFKASEDTVKLSAEDGMTNVHSYNNLNEEAMKDTKPKIQTASGVDNPEGNGDADGIQSKKPAGHVRGKNILCCCTANCACLKRH